MDAHHFDALTRRIGTPSSRRTALGGLLVGLLLPLEAVARKQRKGKGKGASRDTQRVHAQAEPCWRAGACSPSTGSNVSRCDLAGSTAFKDLNCTGCNASRANLRGVNARNANFTRANLSGSCLVGADFTGATFASNTNLSGAIFCNTTMPNGSVNNAGCGAGTPCCSACTPTTCAAEGKSCGTISDGCGGELNCGACSAGATPTCNNGTCARCDATCGAGCVTCNLLADGSTQCGDVNTNSCTACTSDSFCQTIGYTNCVVSWVDRGSNVTFSPESGCGPVAVGVCANLSTC